MNVVESNQVDVFSPAVLCDLKEIQHAQKSGGASQLRSDIGKTDLLDGIDLNLTVLVHAIAPSYLDVRTHPDPNAAGDFTASNTFAQSFREDHVADYRSGGLCRRMKFAMGARDVWEPGDQRMKRLEVSIGREAILLTY